MLRTAVKPYVCARCKHEIGVGTKYDRRHEYQPGHAHPKTITRHIECQWADHCDAKGVELDGKTRKR